MGRIFLRTYTFPVDPTISHSFYVGNKSGGLSTRLFDGMLIHDTTTFKDLRQMIEYKFEKGMFRRTMMYQELMHVMDTCSNPHGYNGQDRRKYSFGVIQGVGEQHRIDENGVPKKTELSTCVPTMIQQEVEDEPIVEIIGDTLKYDVIIVPITQVRPSDNIVSSEINGSVNMTVFEV